MNPEEVFDIHDLVPEDASFSLHIFPDKFLWFSAFSLKYQMWAKDKYGVRIKAIFAEEQIKEICEIAWKLLKSETDFYIKPDTNVITKEAFRDFDHFIDSVRSTKDKIQMITALLKTIGFSQPVLEKAAEKIKSSEEEIKKKILTPPL